MLEEVREKSRTPLFLLLSFYTEVNYYQHFRVYHAFINRKLRLLKLLICCTELKLGLAPVAKLANLFIVNAMETYSEFTYTNTTCRVCHTPTHLDSRLDCTAHVLVCFNFPKLAHYRI